MELCINHLQSKKGQLKTLKCILIFIHGKYSKTINKKNPAEAVLFKNGKYLNLKESSV